jgi:hypothetical protein
MMFISRTGAKDSPRLVFTAATLAGGACTTVGQPFYDVPLQENPAAVVDANLVYLAVLRKDAAGKDVVFIFELQWGLDAAHPNVTLRPMPPVIDTPGQMTAAEYIRKEVSPDSTDVVKSVKTWQARAGSVVSVGGQHFRLFANTAVPQPASASADQNWTRLASASGADCSELAKKNAPGAPIFVHESICFELGLQPQGFAGPGDATQNVIWALYAYTSYQASRVSSGVGPSPLASFPIGAFSNEKQVWVGKTGTEWEGWFGFGEPGKPLEIAPWSTSALAKLGCEVLESEKRSAAGCPAQAVASR